MLTRDQLCRISPLLRLGAIATDLIDAEIGVRPVGETDRSRGPGDLSLCHEMPEVSHTGTTPFRLNRDAERTEVVERRRGSAQVLSQSMAAARGASSAAAKAST